ncbi:hypothetical protein KAW18_16025 [candidate division WOR-3 bacterium]|nr:hypothetical protein [candidate division WOR-3 bacterium]
MIIQKRINYCIGGLLGIMLITSSCSKPKPIGEVFVIGGIHQSHKNAQLYTYERMCEIYQHLKPDILCVETEQKYIDDGSDIGMPFDFQKFMVPFARKDKIPIFGIDWWDREKGEKWKKLQQKAFTDSTLIPEIELIGGMFSLLNDYFKAKDFKEINSRYTTDIWAAKSDFKYHILSQHPEYKFIVEFEEERNNRMVQNIIRIVKSHPDDRILIAVGIDHKYYIERELQKKGIRVLYVEEIIREWWK